MYFIACDLVRSIPLSLSLFPCHTQMQTKPYTVPTLRQRCRIEARSIHFDSLFIQQFLCRCSMPSGIGSFVHVKRHTAKNRNGLDEWKRRTGDIHYIYLAAQNHIVLSIHFRSLACTRNQIGQQCWNVSLSACSRNRRIKDERTKCFLCVFVGHRV